MLRHFRNLAAVVITWYVIAIVGDMLAYVTQFAFGVVGDRGRPGTMLLMHLLSELPAIVVSPLAGAMAGLAVRPRGDSRWMWVLAALFIVRYLPSAVAGSQLTGWGFEDALAVVLIAGLLVAGVHLGGRIVRRKGSRPTTLTSGGDDAGSP